MIGQKNKMDLFNYSEPESMISQNNHTYTQNKIKTNENFNERSNFPKGYPKDHQKTNIKGKKNRAVIRSSSLSTDKFNRKNNF